jgi:hypothetical protein
MGVFRRKVPHNHIPIHPDNIGTNNWIILLEAGTIGKRLLTTAPFVLDFQRAGQAAARGGAAKPTFQGNSWAMRLIG